MNQKIILASKSVLKAQVVLEAASRVFLGVKFDLVQYDLEENGPEPMDESALLDEISSHLTKARMTDKTASFYVAMEGGMRDDKNDMDEIAMVVVENSEGIRSTSRAASFPIPHKIAEKVRVGIPFAAAVDKEYSASDIKNTQGFVGLLTNGLVDKKALYLQPAIIAFSRYAKEDLFSIDNPPY